MTNKYFDLIDQTFYFPQEGFDLDDGNLIFNGIPIIHLIKKYGTPFKLTYVPKIGNQIKKVRNMFARAITSLGYSGKYHFCYCTKCNHFSYVLDEVLRYKTELETSSAFDIELVKRLFNQGKITKDTYIICNGFKPQAYLENIAALINNGHKNVIPVCDNKNEIDYYNQHLEKGCQIGIRVATEEEPNFQFYTSRLGIRNADVVDFYKEKIAPNPKFQFKDASFFCGYRN